MYSVLRVRAANVTDATPVSRASESAAHDRRRAWAFLLFRAGALEGELRHRRRATHMA